MVTEVYSGTEDISTTEWSLTTDTAGPDASTVAGRYQIFLDLSDMVAGDELQIRVYEKVRSGDTQRIAHQWTVVGVPANPVWVSPEFSLMHGWDVTLDAIAGTITVLWSIRDTNTDISSLATASALATVDSNVDAIKAKTDSLAFTVAGQVDANVVSMANNVITSSVVATNALNNSAFTTGFYNSINAEVDTAIQDAFTFTVTGQVDANVESINGAEVLGDGTSGNLWRG